MIEKDINNFQANHEELKRCNSILEDNWTDSSAEQFKTTYLGPIDATCATFIGESFTLKSWTGTWKSMRIHAFIHLYFSKSYQNKANSSQESLKS